MTRLRLRTVEELAALARAELPLTSAPAAPRNQPRRGWRRHDLRTFAGWRRAAREAFREQALPS